MQASWAWPFQEQRGRYDDVSMEFIDMGRRWRFVLGACVGPTSGASGRLAAHVVWQHKVREWAWGWEGSWGGEASASTA
jgi:hypothetical protein